MVGCGRARAVWWSEVVYAVDRQREGPCPRPHLPHPSCAAPQPPPRCRLGDCPPSSRARCCRRWRRCPILASGGVVVTLCTQYPLYSMHYLAPGAVLAGADSWAAIADWAAVTDHDVAVGRRSPQASTFRRLLGRGEVTALEAALTGWVLGRRDTAARQAAATGGPVAERRMVLAADGKTLRGAHQPDGSQTKLLCLYDHAHQLVLAQTPVLDGDEIAAFTTALAALPDLSGVVI